MPFSEQDRRIFCYHNGTEEVWADPRVIQRKLMSFEDFDLETDLKLLRLSNKESLMAFERLVNAGRFAFDIKPFKKTKELTEGLMDDEVCVLIAEFGIWMSDVKKNSEETPSTPNSTEQVASPGEVSQ